MMKTDSRFTVNLITLGVLLAAQIVYLLLPGGMLSTYNSVLPVVYAAVAAAHLICLGRVGEPAPKGGRAAFASGLGVLLYFTGILVVGAIAGFGTNATAPNIAVILSNFWVFVPVAVLSEILRLRMVKGTPPAGRRSTMAVLVTLVFTFAQLDVLRGALSAGAERNVELVFVSFFPILALNAVLTYMACEGSLTSLLLVRVVYALTPVLMPVMPTASRPTWAVVTSTLLFVTVLIYHGQVSGKTGKFRKIAQKAFARKQISALVVLLAAALILGAFILRAFPVFPVAVLSGSMSGQFERGAVVFVEKLAPEDVQSTVEEGQVILFKSGHIEIIHRVVGIERDREGARVYITQGDANPRRDLDPVETGQVVGLTRWYIPYIGIPAVLVHEIFGR